MLNVLRISSGDLPLIDLHELLVPVLDIGRLLAGVCVIVLGGRRVVLVVVTPLENLA